MKCELPWLQQLQIELNLHVLNGQTMQALVNEHSQLKIDVFQRPQPVKVSQHRCDVLILRSTYQSGGGVEHRLKLTELGCRASCECCVAVVEMWHNQRHERHTKFANLVKRYHIMRNKC